MKIRLLAVLNVVTLCCLLSQTSLSKKHDGGNLGLGLMIGGPTAITGKLILSSETAVDFGLGFNFDNSYTVYGDYLFLYPGAIKTNTQFFNELVPYFGVGPIISWYYSRDHRWSAKDRYYSTLVGARVPFGLAWRTPKHPLEIFLEVAPTLDIIPGLYLGLDAGLGARYFF